jgi:hypothetical protein
VRSERLLASAYSRFLLMAEDIRTQGIPQKKLRPLIEKVRARIKRNEVVARMFEGHGIDLSELDLVPMCFADIDVSARTDHGVIYFSTKLLKDGDFDKDDHYLVHELTHFLQQTTGTQPTKGSEHGDYLKNPEEVEGFQNQVEYISNLRGKEKADSYVERVLDHHDQEGNKRKQRKEELMALAVARTNLPQRRQKKVKKKPEPKVEPSAPEPTFEETVSSATRGLISEALRKLRDYKNREAQLRGEAPLKDLESIAGGEINGIPVEFVVTYTPGDVYVTLEAGTVRVMVPIPKKAWTLNIFDVGRAFDKIVPRIREEVVRASVEAQRGPEPPKPPETHEEKVRALVADAITEIADRFKKYEKGARIKNKEVLTEKTLDDATVRFIAGVGTLDAEVTSDLKNLQVDVVVPIPGVRRAAGETNLFSLLGSAIPQISEDLERLQQPEEYQENRATKVAQEWFVELVNELRQQGAAEVDVLKGEERLHLDPEAWLDQITPVLLRRPKSPEEQAKLLEIIQKHKERGYLDPRDPELRGMTWTKDPKLEWIWEGPHPGAPRMTRQWQHVKDPEWWKHPSQDPERREDRLVAIKDRWFERTPEKGRGPIPVHTRRRPPPTPKKSKDVSRPEARKALINDYLAQVTEIGPPEAVSKFSALVEEHYSELLSGDRAALEEIALMARYGKESARERMQWRTQEMERLRQQQVQRQEAEARVAPGKYDITVSVNVPNPAKRAVPERRTVSYLGFPVAETTDAKTFAFRLVTGIASQLVDHLDAMMRPQRVPELSEHPTEEEVEWLQDRKATIERINQLVQEQLPLDVSVHSTNTSIPERQTWSFETKFPHLLESIDYGSIQRQ